MLVKIFTRWLDYLFNILPFRTMKCCKEVKNVKNIKYGTLN